MPLRDAPWTPRAPPSTAGFPTGGSTSEYHEHTPEIPDGPAGLKAGTDAYFKHFPRPSMVPKRVIAEGDLVAVHGHHTAAPNARGRAVIDHFRVRDQKIVEHWLSAQDVPATSSGCGGRPGQRPGRREALRCTVGRATGGLDGGEIVSARAHALQSDGQSAPGFAPNPAWCSPVATAPALGRPARGAVVSRGRQIGRKITYRP